MDSFERLEMDTYCLYLALAHDNLFNCVRPSKKKQSGKLWGNTIVMTLSKLMLYKISSPQLVVMNMQKHDKREQIRSRKNLEALKWFVFVTKFVVATMPNRINTNSAADDKINEHWKRPEMGQWKSIGEW